MLEFFWSPELLIFQCKSIEIVGGSGMIVLGIVKNIILKLILM